MSILFASWVTRIPDIQKKLALNDADLGIGLLGLSIGAFGATFFSGILIRILKTPISMMIGLLGMAVTIIFPVLAGNLFWLFSGLLIFGIFDGFLNIAMNNAAAELERKLERPIMSTCHAMFSIGAMVGAGLGSLFTGFEISMFNHLGIMAIGVFLMSFGLWKNYLTLPEGVIKSQGFKLPTLALLSLTFIGFCVMMGEGVVADWSTLYLEKNKMANGFISPLGFAAFSGAMALGRLSGDSLIPKIGARRMMAIGCFVGGLGFILALISPGAILAVIGFGIAGLGYSVVVPIVFSMAANTPGVAPSSGIAMVAGIGVVGFLAAPPIIGFVSEIWSLTWGFISMAVFALLAFIFALSKK